MLWHHTTHLVDIGLWMVSGGDMASADARIRNISAAYPRVEPRTGIPMELVVVIETHDDQTILPTARTTPTTGSTTCSHVTDRDDY